MSLAIGIVVLTAGLIAPCEYISHVSWVEGYMRQVNSCDIKLVVMHAKPCELNLATLLYNIVLVCSPMTPKTYYLMLTCTYCVLFCWPQQGFV